MPESELPPASGKLMLMLQLMIFADSSVMSEVKYGDTQMFMKSGTYPSE